MAGAEHIRLDWSAIHSLSSNSGGLHNLLQKHQQLFRDELGTLQGVEAVIHVPPHAQPRFYKARPIPYAMKDKVEDELQRLQAAGVISPVEFSDWAAPIVPVVKSDGNIRICGDYSVTVNAVSKLDNYPLPRVDDLFTAMSGGVIFSKLDLKHAYQQLRLSEESKKFTTINTTRGLFQYERLPFGGQKELHPPLLQLVAAERLLVTCKQRRQLLCQPMVKPHPCRYGVKCRCNPQS